MGDACDADDDNDTIDDEFDNCPLAPNYFQLDADGDSLGNMCDPDDDNDGVLDEVDNCPVAYNPSQADEDFDGIGDACQNGSAGGGSSASELIETECQRWFNHVNNLPCTPEDMITVEDCAQAFYEDCAESVADFMDCLIATTFCVDGELEASGNADCGAVLDCQSG